MKTENVLKLLKEKDIVIPQILIKSYRKLNITEKELVYLIYLINEGENTLFDVPTYSENLNWDITEIMEVTSSLCEKKIIDLKVKKEGTKIKESVDVSNLYNLLLMIIIDNEAALEEEKNNNSEIYTIIENEFGRPLSPIEYETISDWLNSNIEETLIKEALKEAVLNGVHRLNYIDKVLREWIKKGYRNSKDIKKPKKKKEEVKDLFEYDWLETE